MDYSESRTVLKLRSYIKATCNAHELYFYALFAATNITLFRGDGLTDVYWVVGVYQLGAVSFGEDF